MGLTPPECRDKGVRLQGLLQLSASQAVGCCREWWPPLHSPAERAGCRRPLGVGAHPGTELRQPGIDDAEVQASKLACRGWAAPLASPTAWSGPLLADSPCVQAGRWLLLPPGCLRQRCGCSRPGDASLCFCANGSCLGHRLSQRRGLLRLRSSLVVCRQASLESPHLLSAVVQLSLEDQKEPSDLLSAAQREVPGSLWHEGQFHCAFGLIELQLLCLQNP
mmetsp:Transcript_65210/g.147085  ORF Transcript_65210/g.147085 Transcript_65210/m.147085 type:complete len:221 (-) Transcript_65210:117-779(-)